MNLYQATESDAPHMASWLSSLLGHVQTSTNDPYITSVSLSSGHEVEQLMRSWVTDPKSIVYVFEDDECKQGFIKAKVTRPFVESASISQVGLIEMLWIEPEARRRGYAKQLVRAVEDWFAQQGIGYIDLHYMLGNHEAEEFWQAIGYLPYHVRSRKTLTIKEQ